MPKSNGQRHVLIFEPRVEGHHIPYLVNIANELLSLGNTVSIAIDNRTEEAKKRILQQDSTLLAKVAILDLFTQEGRFKGGSKLAAGAICLNETQADEIFFNSLDEVASSMFRRAVIGIFPPKSLFKKVSGIYVRPRPPDPSQNGIGNWIKRVGFRKLYNKGFFRSLFLQDEFLVPIVEAQYPNLSVAFLPERHTPLPTLSTEEARAKLGFNTERIVLLSYGIGSRRKGLHLVLEALEHFPEHPFFLLVAGVQEDKATVGRLKQLQAAGKALVLDRYVSSEEEAALFAATDIVLLPYVRHYGSSNVLTKAAFAGKPVLASDFHLIGKRVQTHGLGWVFKHEDVIDLHKRMQALAGDSKDAIKPFRQALNDYAKRCDRTAFSKAIQALFS